MTSSPEARKAELLVRLDAEIRAKAPAALADSAARLLRRLYERAAPDDVLYAPPEFLVGSALALLAFASERKPGTIATRAYTPHADRDGWASEHSVIEVVNDDMPFIVDSTTGELVRRERTLHLVLHPVLRVARDAEGRLLRIAEVDDPDPDLLVESWMQVQIDQESTPADLEAIRVGVESVLLDVRHATSDFQAMRERLRACLERLFERPLPIPEEELIEAEAFLRWLDEGHFVFLGYREYAFVEEAGESYYRPNERSGLGLLRVMRSESLARAARPFPAEWVAFARRPEPLMVTKANSRSTVHRNVHLDRVSVKRYDDAGNVVGEDRFLGLFTSSAYSRSVHRIPLVRRKVARTIARAGLDPKGHDGKALETILETFPRDEVFQVTEEQLFDLAMGILALQERQRIAVFVRRDPFGRYVSCLVYVPRDRHNTELREKVRAVLEEAFQGYQTDFSTQLLYDAPLARTLYLIATPDAHVEVDVKRLEALITEAARTWEDRLRDELVLRRGEDDGITAWRQWRTSFSAGYRERFTPRAAVYDMPLLEAVTGSDRLEVDLFRPRNQNPNELRCKLYSMGPLDPLSDVLPRLEDMGVKVLAEMAYEVRPPSPGEAPRPTVWVRDFVLAAPRGALIDPLSARTRFAETLTRVRRGELESDSLNSLVLLAGLDWPQVVILRAYARYYRQVGTSFSDSYLREALVHNPRVVLLLLDLFALRFDPARQGASREEVEDLSARIEEALQAVVSQDEDRILRTFLLLIKATLRTNFYQPDASGQRRSYVSFKLKSKRVPDLPKPRPMFEVFVYSPRMEGVHLRGGRVARGGIRWSDRREDFRTEILGLIKAQMVKNAVIVPVGSKGGFIVKRPPAGGSREEIQREGIACYKTLVRGLLDITDNLRGGEIVPPRDVVRRDGDDPYLVVAADKGTATFSDLANEVSAEYGHWLGDAFASGGSAGYDHKKMGITARGAWVAVKRHFRELGVDTQSEDFTVAGVGDMSGDVFGNGMLLSPHIRLVAAFDHRHIFIDPSPDAASSFEERARMFDLPRSSWDDYDKSKLSAGGGVYPRSAKTITVSPEAAAALDLADRTVTPQVLMQAILRARVDLLYFGGIGTYVKASDESHQQAGDRANDAVRINANELRCRVIGEGANLGLTQRGRIEFALTHAKTGGKLNTDAIDNSGGVDCSDHEVNIKILLDAAVSRGELDTEERLRLLVEMTDEVADLVLRDNYQQTQALTVAAAQGVGILDAQARFIRFLERAGRLDRALEYLPEEEEIRERQAHRQGLTRPEIAVLLAYSKIWLNDELLGSDLLDDPLFAADLRNYFPTPLRDRFAAGIEEHRLRREIIATAVTNSMVNRVGPTFVQQLMEATGRSAAEVARAYTIVRDIFELRAIWAAIEALDNVVPAALQTSMLLEVGQLLERLTAWFLRSGLELDITARTEELKPLVAALADALPAVLPEAERAAWESRFAEDQKWGLPAELARRIASLEPMAAACDITQLARRSGRPVEQVAAVYYALGSRFDLERLRDAAAALPAETPWQKAAVEALRDDLYAHQGTLAARVLDAGAGEDGDLLERWLAGRTPAVARADARLAELRAIPALDLAMLTVANQALRALAGD